MTVDAELKTYRGSCHCGSYIYEVTVPEITSVTVCDCSICTKKNYMYLWMTPGRDSFKVIKDDGILTDYSFGGSFGINHQFCSKCGVSLIGSTKDGMVLNARTLQNVDLWNMEIKTCDGANLDPKYIPPTYTGPEPKLPDGSSEDGKVYHGSCHCGAITAALKLPSPLEDKDSKERIVECNCSICMKAGFTWIYPNRCQVILNDTTLNSHPSDPGMGTPTSTLKSYAFNRGIFVKTFCSKCGVFMTNELNTSLTKEEIDSWPEESRAWITRMGHIRPFNLRILNNFDFGTLGEPGQGNLEIDGKMVESLHGKKHDSRIVRLDGASRPPVYVNP